jgi:hypothetical protein
MHYITETKQQTPEQTPVGTNIPTSEGLELFAEEMPTQHDLLPTATVGCAFCVGSCVSTVSTVSSL